MTDHIQIGSTVPRAQFVASGSQTSFPYPFPIFQAADMEVFLDDALQGAGYSVTGAGQDAGGAVVFGVAPAVAVVVTLRRRLAIHRTTDFQEGGEFRAKVINDELDYQTAAIQQIADDSSRAVQLPRTSTLATLEVPPPVAGRAWKWNAGATALVNTQSDPDLVVPLATAQATAAAASAATAIAAAASAVADATAGAASAAAGHASEVAGAVSAAAAAASATSATTQAGAAAASAAGAHTSDTNAAGSASNAATSATNAAGSATAAATSATAAATSATTATTGAGNAANSAGAAATSATNAATSASSAASSASSTAILAGAVLGSGSVSTFSATGDGSTATFALGFTPNGAAQVIVTADNVLQEPGVAYSVTGSNITFTTVPTTGQALRGRLMIGAQGVQGVPGASYTVGVQTAGTPAYRDYLGGRSTAGAAEKRFMAEEIAALASAQGGYRTGVYYFPTGYTDGSSTLTVTANRVYYLPIFIGAPVTIGSIGCEVTTGVSSTVIRLGLYRWANGIPAAKVIDAGTVSSATTGEKLATVNTVVEPGVYALAMISDGAPTVRRAVVSSGLGLNTLMFGNPSQGSAANSNLLAYEAGSGSTLPNPANTVTFTNVSTVIPQLFFKV